MIVVPGAHDGLEAGESFERGLRAVALVLGDGDFVVGDFAGFLVLHLVRGGDGHDFVVEVAGFLRRGGALLALQRVFVLRLAADAIALGDGFGGLQHRHVDRAVHRDQFRIGHHAHFLGLHERDAIPDRQRRPHPCGR